MHVSMSTFGFECIACELGDLSLSCHALLHQVEPLSKSSKVKLVLLRQIGGIHDSSPHVRLRRNTSQG